MKPLSLRTNWSAAARTPLLMHLAEEDEYITKDAQAQIKAALGRVPAATVYSYPGQNHAFARHTGLHYNAEAAALAKGRTVAFLSEHLHFGRSVTSRSARPETRLATTHQPTKGTNNG
jgi:dienelactone hydrolase